MIWDWSYIWEVSPKLLDAAIITVQATLAGYALALVGGLVLALLRRARWRVVAALAEFVVDFVRTTPLLVQVYYLYFGLPALGIELDAFTTGALALGLHYSSYTSEVYRAGIDSVPAGQWEAAKALNFGALRKYRSIILPQAVPPIIPVLGNYLVAMFKDTPLLSTIGVLEMLGVARIEGSHTFKYIESFTIVGVIFIVLSLVSALAIEWAERRFSRPGAS